MTTNRTRRAYPVKPGWGGHPQVWLQWLSEIRLRWLLRDIERIEHLLADEFATDDTSALHAELNSLLRCRDVFFKRLLKTT